MTIVIDLIISYDALKIKHQIRKRKQKSSNYKANLNVKDLKVLHI